MKSIAVFQHTEVGAPGAIVSILERLGRKVELIRVVDGDPVPTDPSDYSGLVFMGGYMSVHDRLEWIAREQALIRKAVALDIPVAGHCLGSQLVALALGGTVGPNARSEIGWQWLELDPSATARDWLGDYASRKFETFQWHADTFSPPPEAALIARSDHCSNQIVVVQDKHLLVQSHLEITPDLVRLSMQRNGDQMIRQFSQRNPATSDPAEVEHDLNSRTTRMHGLLARLYARWVGGCIAVTA